MPRQSCLIFISFSTYTRKGHFWTSHPVSKLYEYKFDINQNTGRLEGGLINQIIFPIIYAHFSITIPWDVWRFSTHPINFFIFTVYQIVMGGYIIPALFWRILAIIYSMRKFCKDLSERKALRIIPLSPDKAGGLKPLGDLALTFHFILVLPLIHIVISVYCWGITIGSIVGLLGSTPFVITVFFLPLSGAHNAMKKAKDVDRSSRLKKGKAVNPLSPGVSDEQPAPVSQYSPFSCR